MYNIYMSKDPGLYADTDFTRTGQIVALISLVREQYMSVPSPYTDRARTNKSYIAIYAIIRQLRLIGTKIITE